MKRPLQTFRFSISNSSNDSVDIHIDGDIVDASTQAIYKAWFGDDTSVSFKSFRDELNATSARTYNVYINSGGGMVTDAMAIHDLLVDFQSKGKTVNTIGRGIVASAATYILMASKNAEMSKNSWLMIHNVSGGVYGDVNEIESYAVTLRKFNDSARDFYANATGTRKEDVTKMMNAETWMTADEAKTKGFVKKVSGDASFTNSISADHWMFNNTEVLAAYNSAVGQPPIPTHALIQNQFTDMKKFFQQILDAMKGAKPTNQTTGFTGEELAALMQKPFEDMATEIDTQITSQTAAAVTAQLTTQVTAAVKPAVDTAVASAIAPLNLQIADLKTKNTELEQEITKNKGGASGGAADPNAPAPIGGFKK